MELFYTPRSHFSRKVRILLDAWNVTMDLRDVGNVAVAEAAAFGPNPLMKVPTLIDGDTAVFDSDHISEYLVRRHDPEDTFAVGTKDVSALNARAVMNGVMAAEVEILLARRSGIDTSTLPRFDKILGSIRQGLAWLESNADVFPESPSYAGVHLVSMWDHLALYQVVPLGYPCLAEHVSRMSALAWVRASAPML